MDKLQCGNVIAICNDLHLKLARPAFSAIFGQE